MNQSLNIDLSGIIQSVIDAGLMVSTLTVKAPPTTLDATGVPTGAYTDVSGLVDIQCMDAPENTGSSFSAWEKNEMQQVESYARRHVLLNGYYPELSPSTNWGDVGWRAVVTNTVTGEVQTYDIRGAEADSQQIMTRVSLRAVTT